MTKKKILYFIYSSINSSGGGGHFHSLNTISKSLAPHIDYEIINFGYSKGNALKDEKNCIFFQLSKWDLFFKLNRVLKEVKSYNPEIIHAFDGRSLFIARTIALFYNVKIVFNKCGGPNGNPYFISEADTQILFSKENFDFYFLNGGTKTPKYLIPNRISEIIRDENHVGKFKQKYNIENEFIVMRISRFVPYYNSTFKQTINLFKEIHKTNPESRLLFIGLIQSQSYFEKLKDEIEKENLPIDFITDKEFTTNAKRLIEIANIVVATGRGVMEACAFNKRVYCPVKDSDFPLILNNKTFEFLFSTNFSERADLNQQDEIIEEFDIIKIEDELVDTRVYFEKHFSIENAVSEYLEIYENVTKKPFNIFNYIANLLRFIK